MAVAAPALSANARFWQVVVKYFKLKSFTLPAVNSRITGDLAARSR